MLLGGLALASAPLVACDNAEVPLGFNDPEHADDYVLVADIPPTLSQNLDLLFVVDNSANMTARQLALTSSFRALTDHLRNTEGGLPNLHVGVVSTDMGAGPFGHPGCAGSSGLDGALQVNVDLPECRTLSEPFLASYELGDGQRFTNFAGELEDNFACLAALGESGCIFPQPLRALRRALEDQPDNRGFLRINAVLAVVLLTDSDDCSASGDALFDPNLAAAVGDLTFRCFQFGVTCSGADDVYLPGHREGCSPRENSEYLPPVTGYAQFLSSLKASPDQVVVAGIMGDPSLVEVGTNVDGVQQLVPACLDATGDGAEPAVRLQGLLDSLARGTEFRSICDGVSTAVSGTAQQIRRALGTHCLENYLRDVDPAPGRQVDCLVADVSFDGQSWPMQECSNAWDTPNSTDFPCYAIKTGVAQCSSFPTQLGIQVARNGQPAPPKSRLRVECLVDPPPREL